MDLMCFEGQLLLLSCGDFVSEMGLHLDGNEVQNGGHRALPSRLPVGCQQLQLLLSPESDPDMHRKLFKVLESRLWVCLLVQLNFSSTPNALEAVAKVLVDLFHCFLQLWQPGCLQRIATS